MRKIRVLVKKEVMDILRDRKTLIMMVVVPILLYPLLLLGITLGVGFFMQSQSEKVHTAGFETISDAALDELKELYEKNKEEIGTNLDFIRGTDADAWLEVAESDNGYDVKIHYISTEQDSRYACEAMEELLDIYQEKLLSENLKEKGLPQEFLHPVKVESIDQASESESFGMDIGGSIGMMLIVTILMGAMYPAIDATAGEKERGTLETLLTLPVSNFELIMSKYLSVALFSCVTAIISLISLGGSALILMSSVTEEVGSQIPQFSALLPAIPVILMTMVAVALFITAVCMCFCVFARSFKEANNYITPVLLVIMFASMAAMIPTLRLDYQTALIPVVNVSLMIKQILAQQFSLSLAGVTIGVNAGYSILIVWVLSRIYNSEDILFSDGFRGFRLFQKRSDIKKGTVPGAGDAAVIVTATFLLLIYVGTAATVHLGFWGAALQQLMILVIPVAAVWYMKSDVKELFSLHVPRASGVPGGLLLYLGTYCIMITISVFLVKIMPESSVELAESYEMLTEQPLFFVLLVLALMPAVGEELLFRGFVMGSIRHRHGAWWAIFVSALVFGIFHMSLLKLLPTAMLGACFAVIVWRTGTIYIGMFLHFLNNTISFLTIKYPEKAVELVPFLMKETLSLQEILCLLLAGIVLGGAGWIILKRRSTNAAEE
ncbi:MAG: ABC transporter permease subunit/CPBP intramembrane protease [Eubacteriales bacterium]|nr:ABC transporter permease subunit/CPBP intramembrane protease [Eubacteriales bacterium]